MNDTYQTVLNEYERWISRPSDDEDVRPLMRAAAVHLKHGTPLPEVAPCLAILYFSMVEFEHGIFVTALAKFTVWLLRSCIYRGRPMWNDFLMVLWALSRDPRYIGRLHSHLKHATPIQQETGLWMITSVCQQDAEFAEHWSDAEREHGAAFA